MKISTGVVALFVSAVVAAPVPTTGETKQPVRRFEADSLVSALLNPKAFTKDIDFSLLGIDKEDLPNTLGFR
ncbi:hypothetical protein P170DRAFT_476570 [Aspergillus steynii IBT 23096]|uniref:Uncharacterized protein n=1 Tax=Aspergillus steynii IBT 23096 TaxID=1392250 RepID=A0A2I2G4X1_9EURO|nr:uncharacterized protein P170DRAFT_476570 [Aspergillus steynii IBT 23096]PLB47917.1 hypothetical protein P170DRAFT_476570 [Aspergillus steynii IBT 23096]